MNIRVSSSLAIGALLGLVLSCSGATTNSSDSLVPPEVSINKDAGRGGSLVVMLRLENGEEAPFIVDTGTTGTLLDESLEPILGKPRERTTINGWGKKTEVNVYAAPKLYLGNVQLKTGRNVLALNLQRFGARSGLKPLGLLGFDCLRHYCIQLDFESGKMRFLDSPKQQAETLGKAFPITLPRGGGRPFIYHVNLAGVPSTNELTDPAFLSRRDGMSGAYALVDTGFSGDGRIGKGSVEGHDSGRLTIPHCVWEDQTYTNVIVGVEEQANLLGLRFLARHLVTLDFPNHTMYLKQTRVGPLE